MQVWASLGGVLRPVLRVGERVSPARALVVSEGLGGLVSCHAEGQVICAPWCLFDAKHG